MRLQSLGHKWLPLRTKDKIGVSDLCAAGMTAYLPLGQFPLVSKQYWRVAGVHAGLDPSAVDKKATCKMHLARMVLLFDRLFMRMLTNDVLFDDVGDLFVFPYLGHLDRTIWLQTRHTDIPELNNRLVGKPNK